MEEKSIDQLRREAQELYQAKLQAYLQAQNPSPKEAEQPKKTPQNNKIQQPEPVTVNDIKSSPLVKSFKEPRQRHNWFVVSIFLIVLLVVLIELFLFAPGR